MKQLFDLPSRYDPENVESKWYKFWVDNCYFAPVEDESKPTYTIVIPPPNVTGILHMGHGLNNTLQDVLVRYKRMDGFRTLWIPGTDHAGIATQNVVERMLKKDDIAKTDLGRPKFLEKVWEWKEEYGNTIINQLKRLGSSCDWDRQRFTMDEGLSKAVRAVFVRLYKDDLVYRGSYIVNWCPRCETALADEEVDHSPQNGKLFYMRYPVKDSDEYVVIATTRPETMLGDTAVAVHPDDDRYKHLVGKTIVLPILNREIPVVADDYVEREFGTGVVKITPAHDPNDFEIGRRHRLPQINVMTAQATMNENAGPYEGQDRYECRKNLLDDLDKAGLLDKVEDYENKIGSCYRCHTVVEPYISEQWFVKMQPLAEPAIEAVKSGKIKFVPERWNKVYLHWMENIRDWCISRQIWWGHRIPVWYCQDCGHLNVEEVDPTNCSKCNSDKLVQDEDVLDTWFSSWLWPFSTLGWPEDKVDMKTFYPTNCLVTDPGIIFFWVARMIMAGMKFMDDIPFDTVYIHGTVRDDQGRKMSKSLGNGIDPIAMIEKYSADALRFSLMMLTSEGQDVSLSESKFEMGRNFSNKLWNAARFVLMNADFDESTPSIEDLEKRMELADQWILHQLNDSVAKIRTNLDRHAFNETAHSIYNFVWHNFCDWYVEMIKPRLYMNGEYTREDHFTSLFVAVRVLDSILRFLHPFMPFITEELWQKIKVLLPEEWLDHPYFQHLKGETIVRAAFPCVTDSPFAAQAQSMEKMIDLIYNIRKIRGEMNIGPHMKVDLFLLSDNADTVNLIAQNKVYFEGLIQLSDLTIADLSTKTPQNASEQVIQDVKIVIPVPEEILAAEKARVEKELQKLEKDIQRLEQKLGNKNFVDRAPEQIVQKEREKYQECKNQYSFLLEKKKNFS